MAAKAAVPLFFSWIPAYAGRTLCGFLLSQEGHGGGTQGAWTAAYAGRTPAGFLLTQEGHGGGHKGPGLLLTQEGHRGAGRRYGTLSRPACGSLAVAALAGLYHQGRGDFDSFGEIVTKMANVAFRKPLCCLRWGWGPGGFLAEPGCMNNLSLSGAEADHRPPRFDPPSDSAHAH